VLKYLYIDTLLDIAVIASIFAGYFGYWSPTNILISILLVAIVMIIPVASLSKSIYTKAHCRHSALNEVVLSFDDGPVPQTLDILAVLRKHQVKAVFFVVGKHCERHPDILDAIIAEGHQIGNHSYSHSPTFDLWSAYRLYKDFQKTQNILLNHLPKATKWVRPPYGVTTPSMGWALQFLNLQTIGWSLRTFDTMAQDSQALLKKIDKQVKGGDILLLHDHGAFTVAILDDLITNIQKRGWRIAPLK
jgi:peptidoglycan/xylan/chitin deacetylase (PgdA/CDA1 family)